MAKVFLVCPGEIKSKTDGQRHYISASQIMRLYGVNPLECVVLDYERWDRNPDSYLGHNLNNMVKLVPLYGGAYKEVAVLKKKRAEEIKGNL